MTGKDRIPDWLTGARVLVALAILGVTPLGPSALRTVAFLLLLGWTTDMVDGRLARRWDKDPTWIGEHEFHIDMVMVLASAVYLVLSGLVPALPGAAYILVASAISLALLRLSTDFLRFKSVTMLLACPWVFAPFVVALGRDPVVIYGGLLWAAAALVLDWRRFLGVVGDFLAGARAFLRR